MKLKLFSSAVILLSLSAYQWAAPNSTDSRKFSPRVRSFHFTYSFTVKDIPAGAKRMRVWIPVPNGSASECAHCDGQGSS